VIVVREIEEGDRQWLGGYLESHWGLPIVTISDTYGPSSLAGYLAIVHGERVWAPSPTTFRIRATK
jgi:hypothetical protein